MRESLPRPADRIALASTLSVSPLCVGIVHEPDTIHAAYEIGMNFFFISTDLHWPRYEHTRRGLRSLLRRDPSIRSRIVVAAASYMTQPAFCSMPFRELLESVPELGHIDVAVLGGVYPQDFMPRLPVYFEHRRARFVGTQAIGASFHDRPTAAIALERELVDVAFVRFNAGHARAREQVFPVVAERRSTKLFVFKSMSGFVPPDRLRALGVPADNWTPTETDHYRFVLSHEAVDGILCALSSPAQVSALAEAIERGPIDDDEAEYMMKLAGLAAGDLALT